MSESEVLIIGGGIAGTSTAYHLAALGRDVTLLERGDIASEASGANAGAVGAIGWGAVPDLQAYLTMGSLEIFKSMQIDLGYDIEFRASGALQAVHNEAQYEFIRDRVLAQQSGGYRVELLTAREARAIEPALNPALPAYMYSPLRAQANPVRATRSFADASHDLGARILTGREVTGVKHLAGGSYRIDTPGEEYRAQILVLAAGAWCGPLGSMLGLDIPVVPVRGQMWSTAPLPPRVFGTISSAESSLDWSAETGRNPGTPPELTHQQDTRVTLHLYGRQTADGEIIFGGDRQIAGYDKTPDAAGIEANRGHAAEVLPVVRDLPLERTWAGLMPFSLDGKPIIGKLPGPDACYIVSGLASSGFGRGPMAGKLIADYIHTGHRPQVLSEADPARCVNSIG